MPAPNIWVFIAPLLEHCSSNAEAVGSNPGTTAMIISPFHLYSRSSNHVSFQQRAKMNSINDLLPTYGSANLIIIIKIINNL